MKEVEWRRNKVEREKRVGGMNWKKKKSEW
jgi:hypothetical protein